MNRSKAETALARRVVQGDAGAWEELVVEHYPGVLALHSLATGDAEAAGSLTDATFQEASRDISSFLRDDEPFSHWITGVAREVEHRFLSEDDWRATPWAQGQEILSDPPLATPLQTDDLHGEGPLAPGSVHGCLEGLAPGHQLLTRLIFLEGMPSGRLAGMLAASSMFVRSFTYGLLDQLGSLETLEHGGDECEPGLTLALRALEQRHDQRALKELLLSNQECPGCQTLVFRVLRMAEALAEEPVEEAGGPPREALAPLLALVAASPDSQAPRPGEAERPPAPRVIPLKARPQVRNERQRLAHWAFAAAILLVFVGGTFSLLRDGPPRRADGRTLGGEEPAAASRRAADDEAVVGYYSGRTGRKHVLRNGQPLHASPLGASAVTFVDGGRAVLTASSAMVAGRSTMTLNRGRTLIDLAGLRGNRAFRVEAGRASFSARKGVLAVTTQPGQGAVFAIKGGSAEVVLPDGSTISVDPFRQLRVAADGTYRVEDTTSGAFSEAGTPDLPGAGQVAGSGSSTSGTSGASGASSSATRATLLGRYAAGGRGQAGGSTGYGSGPSRRGSSPDAPRPPVPTGHPPDNGVMTPGDRPRPGTVRGFRDAF